MTADVDAVLNVLVLAIGLAIGVGDDDSIVNRPLVTVVVGGVPETDSVTVGASELSKVEDDDEVEEEVDEDDDVEIVDSDVSPFVSGTLPFCCLTIVDEITADERVLGRFCWNSSRASSPSASSHTELLRTIL
ncbi:hypothetical protein BG006_001902 [Podila minutissima]|uniref:Secreted protein n=1 Tax=Podila minutissima TaxID=64525 RepID=A0A9P5VP80_9FUNG|nr:hypothetical protein BG006_001902 [Podila minutissima]